jgi:hypothetical protein
VNRIDIDNIDHQIADIIMSGKMARPHRHVAFTLSRTATTLRRHATTIATGVHTTNIPNHPLAA